MARGHIHSLMVASMWVGLKNNKKHGQGTFTYPDGGKYVGEWQYNKKHGQGEYTFPDGSKNVGKFKDDKYLH